MDIESPCIDCSSEQRKEVREQYGVNSCKTVCGKWKPYDEQERLKKEKLDKLRHQQGEAYAVKLASIIRTTRRKKK